MPGSDLNITLPVVGTDSWPVWADRVTSALTTIINDIEAQVVTSEIFENADHDFNGFALTEARWLTFRTGNTSDIPTYGAGFKNGDFYVCDSAGNQIQVSSGGVLAGIGNGFRGDTAYAKYTASSSLYEFLDSSANYDDIKADNVIVANGGTAAATIGFGGSVNTAFTLPSTAAAGVSVLTIDSAGQLAHNATIAVGFTVNNADVTLSGTADIKYPNRSFVRRAAVAVHGANVAYTVGTRSGTTVATGSISYGFSLDIEVGWRLKTFTVRMNKGDANTTTASVWTVGSTGTATSITLSAPATSSSTGNVGVSGTVSTPAAVAAGESVTLELSVVSAAANTVYSIEYTCDRV